MAVEIKYVVVRGGVEKMTFASKKEADAYDKLLDTADELMTLLAGARSSWHQSSKRVWHSTWQNSAMCCKPCCAAARFRQARKRKRPQQPSARISHSNRWPDCTDLLFLGINSSPHSFYLHLKPYLRLFTPRIF